MTEMQDSLLAIETNQLRHSFGHGSTAVRVLHDVELTVRRGEVVILMGPSGSGKTTVLTLVGCLRSVQEGSVRVLGQELAGADNETLMLMRRRIGFIFQAHNLHDSLTALQNVRIGLEIHGRKAMQNWRPACEQLLSLVGLSERMDFLPDQLSGGQKQRVAVARALVGNPEIVFADEPTAALDAQSGRSVVGMLRKLADQRKTTVFMVTHDHRVLDFADRVIKMEEGRIVSDSIAMESRSIV
jgi:putative ABC transport system ATP-binding protein